MKFAAPFWLFGTGVGLVVAIMLVVSGLRLLRSIRQFGDEAAVLALVTGNASGRRAIKGVLLVLTVALGFVALAQPQYGHGTRLIPATNLDVVIVLDYSKSMYARDVKPSRIARAKSEVGRLIAELPGARFGAIAFAGQPMSFPLTSDGTAIAQFFRQLSPSDMPVGGTAIARALESGRELLDRDPLAKKHRRVMLLVTDGEDLEGDPLAVAESAKQNGITIHVVQIGGRTPEPLPEMDESGEVTGWRTDDEGRPITTSLSADGEAQLAKIAELSGGTVVRSQRGETGIREVAASFKRLMTEELSERVETVYADVYMYPLALAILLLMVETSIPETKRRSRPTRVPPPKKKRFRRRVRRPTAEDSDGRGRPDSDVIERGRGPASNKTAAKAAVLTLALCAGSCRESDELFTRNAPAVTEAISALDAGDAGGAVTLLENYLSTGQCENGNIGTPESVRSKPNAGFDLGLGLFALAERYGRRFGEEDPQGDAAATPEEEAEAVQRKAEVECALRIVRMVAGDASLPIDLRARAHYLAGNLEFLRREYRSAVTAYDLAIRLIPGLPGDGGDGIGRDAAYNRAIALRRIEEDENRRDAGQDGPDAPPDAPPDSADAAQESGDDGKANDENQPDAGQKKQEPDAGDDQDKGPDAGGNQDKPDAGQQQPPPEEPRGQSPSVNQDERMLDMLEEAPTLQQHDAKNRALQRGGSTMVDK